MVQNSGSPTAQWVTPDATTGKMVQNSGTTTSQRETLQEKLLISLATRQTSAGEQTSVEEANARFFKYL